MHVDGAGHSEMGVVRCSPYKLYLCLAQIPIDSKEQIVDKIKIKKMS